MISCADTNYKLQHKLALMSLLLYFISKETSGNYNLCMDVYDEYASSTCTKIIFRIEHIFLCHSL